MCVRAGFAPYFTKYGYSRRYHAEFLKAEEEAKAAHRGIWAAGTMHAPDYPERNRYWRLIEGQAAASELATTSRQ